MPAAISNIRLGRAADEAGLVQLYFNVTVSGTYPTGGEIIDFSSLLPPGVRTDMPPIAVNIMNQGGSMPRWINGTDMKTGKMLQFVVSVAGVNQVLTQHTNVAYVAGITGDVFSFQVTLSQYAGF